MAKPTTTPGGIALDAAGNLADMPRDLAHSINHELLHVLALLHCAMGEVDGIKAGSEASDTFHDAESRAVSLLIMSRDKVRAAVDALGPYV